MGNNLHPLMADVADIYSESKTESKTAAQTEAVVDSNTLEHMASVIDYSVRYKVIRCTPIQSSDRSKPILDMNLNQAVIKHSESTGSFKPAKYIINFGSTIYVLQHDYGCDLFERIFSMTGNNVISIPPEHLSTFDHVFNGTLPRFDVKNLQNDLNEFRQSLAYLGCNLDYDIRYNVQRLLCREVSNFFDKYSDYLYSDEIANNIAVTGDFYERRRASTFTKQVFKYKKLSEEIIDWYKDQTTDFKTLAYIADNPRIPEKTIEKYIIYLDPESVCNNEGLSEAFFRRNPIIIRPNLGGNSRVGDKFCEEFFSKLGIEYMRRNTSLTERFFGKHLSKLGHSLVVNKNISSEFILAHPDVRFELNKDIRQNAHLSTECIEELLKIYSNRNVVCQMNLPVEFFENNIHHIDWVSISSNRYLPLSFFEKYIERINSRVFIRNPLITSKFLTKYIQYFGRDDVCRFGKLPVESIDLNASSYIKWDLLCKNPHIDASVFQKYSDRIVWDSIWQNSGLSFAQFDYLFRLYNQKYYNSREIKWRSVSSNTFEGYLNKKIDALFTGKPLEEKLYDFGLGNKSS